MSHHKQDFIRLAKEVKKKHGSCVVLGLKYVNGLVKKMKIHYFHDCQEAADYITKKFMKAEYQEEMAFEECSVKFPCNEYTYLQFFVIDEEDFNRILEELKKIKGKFESSRMRSAGRLSPRSIKYETGMGSMGSMGSAGRLSPRALESEKSMGSMGSAGRLSPRSIKYETGMGSMGSAGRLSPRALESEGSMGSMGSSGRISPRSRETYM